MSCNCEYCVKCDCGHKADEHMAGDGPCYICNCQQFHSPAMDAWDRLNSEEQKKLNFIDFIDRWLEKI